MIFLGLPTDRELWPVFYRSCRWQWRPDVHADAVLRIAMPGLSRSTEPCNWAYMSSRQPRVTPNRRGWCFLPSGRWRRSDYPVMCLRYVPGWSSGSCSGLALFLWRGRGGPARLEGRPVAGTRPPGWRRTLPSAGRRPPP